MKVIKNPTNVEIVSQLCKLHPNSSYAKLVNFDEKTGKIDEDALKLFTSQPDVANEFISDMANKVVVQRAYDLFRDYEMPFKIFMRDMSKLGDPEELLSAELAVPEDYGTTTDPFDADKPSIVLAWIKTEDKKVTHVKLSYEIWAGAFVKEQGLSNIAGIILKNLRDALEKYVYGAIKTDLSSSTNITKSKQITTISGAGETANAQKAYEEILKLVADMALPSTTYNNAGVETFTPKGRGVLILNSLYKSSFDVNVLASLFNSSNIAENKYFKEVIVAPLTGTKQVGVYMDEEGYLFGYRFDLSDSIRNPATLEINTFYHRWVKRAVVPFRQAVRLVTA